jgi:hypothetical protein
VALVITDVSEERIASIIKMKGISEMMEAIYYSETSDFTRATQRHIPGDGILKNMEK